jgi:hypothetical protein
MSNPTETERHTTQAASAALIGRTIVAVRYMSVQEAREMCWFHRAMIVELNDGTRMFASADEEMNDAGVLWIERRDRELCLGRLPA